MLIREATHKDIPQILRVLKASLGETSSKKTEEVWRYKHIDNPFGASLVLLAEEDEKIIGVRAFMRWRWQKGEEIFSAFRAVDTATHPKHQGKGIFKRLTLRALELGKERGDHFVFNTPNSQSKPGYLKMGWKEVDKLKVRLRPLGLFPPSSTIKSHRTMGNLVEVQQLLNTYQEQMASTGKLFTPKNIDYIKWRYLNNPMQNYEVICSEKCFIAAYVKEQKRISEFRVSEAIIAKSGKKLSKMALINLAKTSGANILSISPAAGIKFKTGITGKFGPVLTYKPINLCENGIVQLKTWSYSLGDLELF